jgi:hypothetical protein
MPLRYRAVVLVTSLTLTLLGAAAPAPQPHCGTDLRLHYSPRALRHLRAALQLRVLEARRDRIAAASAILARHGSPDVLLRMPDDAAILAQGSGDVRMKHLSLKDATLCW